MEKEPRIFWEWVDHKMAELGIRSFRELERRAGVSNGTVGSRRNQQKIPTVEMAEGMCQALCVSWTELWEKAGYVQRAEERALSAQEEQRVLNVFRHFSAHDRDAALRMLHGLARWYTLEDDASVAVSPEEYEVVQMMRGLEAQQLETVLTLVRALEKGTD